MLRPRKATSTAKFFCTGTLQGCKALQKGEKTKKWGAPAPSLEDARRACPPTVIEELFEKIKKN